MFTLINHVKNFISKLKLISMNFGKKGHNVAIARGFEFIQEKNIFLSDNIYIGPNATIYAHGTFTVKEGTIIGPNFTAYTANHNYKGMIQAIPYDEKLIIKDVTINENVWIGGNVVITPGTIVGEGSIIAAGSVVVKEVEPYSIVGGNPAQIISYRDKAIYDRLKEKNQIYVKLKKEKRKY